MASNQSQGNQTVFYVQQAFKLSLSLVLFYAFALWTNWDVPRYGGLAIVIVSLGTHGASIKQGLMRIAGTTAGVLIGIVILALFNDDRWATMLALAANIALMCYFMLTSNYRYAWYAAAFIPLVVWADNYPHFDDVFYFTTFRWLETVVGVAIYTLVDLVFWPHRSGDQLHKAGIELLNGVQSLLGAYRQQFSLIQEDPSTHELRSKVAQQLSSLLSSLQDAQFDTPAVRSHGDLFGAWRSDVLQLLDVLEMWRESAIDSQARTDQLPPETTTLLETVDVRLSRISTLWNQWFSNEDLEHQNDDHLLNRHTLHLEENEVTQGAEFEYAALLSTIRQLEELDRLSYELLVTMRHLCGLDPTTVDRKSHEGGETVRPMLWDAERFTLALFPSLTFIAAWFVWDLTDPPGGAKVAMLAGLLSIMIVRTPMNPLGVWVGMILSTAFFVAPITWLVMPALSTGLELLSLIFFLSFFFAILGAKSPALKSGALIQFFASAGISNQQTYSFEGPVNGSLMVLIGGSVVTIIYNLWFPLHPEQSLLRSLRSTLLDLANYARNFRRKPNSSHAQQNRHRKYLMLSKIRPALDHLQHVVGSMDFDSFSDNQREDWTRLVGCLQSLAFRFESFGISYLKGAARVDLEQSRFAEKIEEVMNMLSEVLTAWSKLDKLEDAQTQQDWLSPLRDEMHDDVSNLMSTTNLSHHDPELLADAYAVLGSLCTVIRAFEATHESFQKVDCQQIATPHF